MITDDERREVAQRLRKQAEKLGPNMDAPEFAHYTADVLDVDGNMTWYEMELRLADLIEPQPERTCRIKPNENFDVGEPPYICDACGATIDTKFFFMDGLRVHEFRYCPNCRSKAVEDD